MFKSYKIEQVVAGVTVRLVRKRMQALSSRYGRVLFIHPGVMFYVPL
jgi:hypothetical protein